MIRPFDWRDLTLLHRLRSHGLCLDSHLDYTRGPDAFQDALLDPFSRGQSTCTLVYRPDDRDHSPAVGQFTHKARQPFAHLTFIGPIEALSQPGGMRLLDALSQAAGERGVHHLIAEVEETSPAFEGLRHAGFAVYARQHIWRLTEAPRAEIQPLDIAWRLEAESDEPAIRSLYHNLVPDLVQQVESPPVSSRLNLVHWDQEELLGYLDIKRGPRGIWAQAYIHPAAERADQLLAGFMAQFNPMPDKPLFICVRTYQAGLSGSLDRLGFTPFSDQAVMVKRLTAVLRERVPSTLPKMEGTQPEPTAPFSNLPSATQASHDHPVRETS
ncbi:MAG: hypothetical protein GTO14_10195 [Anaerolineales bacterium]|nr:hypothetical protein [Anaerolineales bacterium]